MDKLFSIGERFSSRSPQKIAAEVQKCVLLCANCHRKVHRGLLAIPQDADRPMLPL